MAQVRLVCCLLFCYNRLPHSRTALVLSRLWLALAIEEKALGLEITDEQITQMSNHLHDIDFKVCTVPATIVSIQVLTFPLTTTLLDLCPSLLKPRKAS